MEPEMLITWSVARMKTITLKRSIGWQQFGLLFTFTGQHRKIQQFHLSKVTFLEEILVE